MTTPDERAEERDRQKHEAEHPGCDARYWRERALAAERAIITAIRRTYADCEEVINYSSGSGVEAILELLHRHRDKALGVPSEKGTSNDRSE
jgi:hypothetical protein